MSAARASYLLVAGAFLGLVFGSSTLPLYSFGVFIGELTTTFHWPVAQTSLAFSFVTAVMFLGATPIGRLADRFDPARIAALSMLSYAAVLMAMPYWIGPNVVTLWIGYCAIAAVGLGATPTVLLKPVVASFDKNRGVAVGISLAGIGVGGFIAPPLTTALVEHGGWRFAYGALSVCVAVAAPLVWLLLRTRSAPIANDPKPASREGLSFSEARRERAFWLLSAIAIAGGFALTGIVTQLIPYLRGVGYDANAAASIASLLGVTSIVGRLATGALLDRIQNPILGAAFFVLGAAGIALLLVSQHTSAVWISVVLIGLALGSEIDLLAYFASRYFGLREHAALFGWCYGLVALGGVISPFTVGALRDYFGDYTLGLTLLAATFVLAAALCPLLGAYRFAVTETAREKGERHMSRVAVVVGGASGMGLSAAQLLAADGYSLVLADRNEALLKEVSSPLNARCIAGDIQSNTFLNSLAASADRVDALVISAGLSQAMGTFADILTVNLAGHAAVLDSLAPNMSPGGCAVLFASMAAHRAPPLDDRLIAELDNPTAPDLPDRIEAVIDKSWLTPGGAYALSKVGVIRMARRKAVEWASRGVRVCSISPGAIHTPMHTIETAARTKEASWWVDRAVAATPAKRFGRAEEVAAVAAFLCSPKASFINGSDILVDGGWIAAYLNAEEGSPLKTTPLKRA